LHQAETWHVSCQHRC